MGSSNNIVSQKSLNKFFIYFKEPVNVFDNLVIWCKCWGVEGIKPLVVSECYKVFHIKINDRLKIFLNEQKFLLECIAVSEWFPKNETQEKIVKLFCRLDPLRRQITLSNRKSATSVSMEYNNNEFRIIYIGFKREQFFKKNNNINNINILLNFIFDFELKKVKTYQNPFSRNFSVDFKLKIFQRDNYTCKYYGWKNGINNKDDRILTIDHIVPVAHGGTSKEDNVITSCLQCNIKKNDKILDFLIKKAVKDKQNQECLQGGNI